MKTKYAFSKQLFCLGYAHLRFPFIFICIEIIRAHTHIHTHKMKELKFQWSKNRFLFTEEETKGKAFHFFFSWMLKMQFQSFYHTPKKKRIIFLLIRWFYESLVKLKWFFCLDFFFLQILSLVCVSLTLAEPPSSSYGPPPAPSSSYGAPNIGLSTGQGGGYHAVGSGYQESEGASLDPQLLHKIEEILLDEENHKSSRTYWNANCVWISK